MFGFRGSLVIFQEKIGKKDLIFFRKVCTFEKTKISQFLIQRYGA